MAWLRKLATIAWWLQVTVQPDSSNINVFNNGISHGFSTAIPLGGHKPPISTAGDKLLWKKAQKKATKKKFQIL